MYSKTIIELCLCDRGYLSFMKEYEYRPNAWVTNANRRPSPPFPPIFLHVATLEIHHQLKQRSFLSVRGKTIGTRLHFV